MRAVLIILAVLGLAALVAGVAIPLVYPQATLDLQSRMNVYWGGLAGGGLAALIGGIHCLVKLEAADRIAAAIRESAARDGQQPQRQPAPRIQAAAGGEPPPPAAA